MLSFPILRLLSRLSTYRYHTRVLDHFENPRNVGSFNSNEANIATAYVGAPACGDVMKLQIKVDKLTNRIIDTRFKTFGCGSAIAASSVATEWVKGKTLSEARDITNKDIAAHLLLPPVKLHCSMLAEQAIIKAIDNFQIQ